MIVKMTQFETLLKVKILFCKVQSEYIWCSNLFFNVKNHKYEEIFTPDFVWRIILWT